ncbi:MULTISPECIES: YceI family protein [Shewanella]|jgi:polyisoprenoid-binding protein YceI|uniref:YceI family protein n=2 Tax=Unclassified Bacteria TaxID=49928 RepID=A0AAU6VL43_UNCXX|nr:MULTISPECIES: YceI family protein [Shewanella]MBO2616057.1 YceI family protein [Shewanella algae]MBO2653724.1 YceI family protein [Shewanella algae]MBO2696253.1 YceI family protein [Shewanella algae]MCT8979103.1 YceI family protein [Shewanella algae]MDE0565511.1 YceI family protein [Shewanella sp. K8]
MQKWISLLALGAFSNLALAADWQLDNADSKVSFVSVKKGDIAEVHEFNQVSGTLAESGEFKLEIPLNGVNTGIEIRDKRMQTMLFEVANFPSLTLTAQVPADLLDKLKPGELLTTEIDGVLSLHGKSQNKRFGVVVARLGESSLLVTSQKAVIVNAEEFGLTDGVEKLREIAGLSSISKAVPVSFVLRLNK